MVSALPWTLRSTYLHNINVTRNTLRAVILFFSFYKYTCKNMLWIKSLHWNFSYHVSYIKLYVCVFAKTSNSLPAVDMNLQQTVMDMEQSNLYWIIVYLFYCTCMTHSKMPGYLQPSVWPRGRRISPNCHHAVCLGKSFL